MGGKKKQIIKNKKIKSNKKIKIKIKIDKIHGKISFTHVMPKWIRGTPWPMSLLVKNAPRFGSRFVT